MTTTASWVLRASTTTASSSGTRGSPPGGARTAARTRSRRVRSARAARAPCFQEDEHRVTADDVDPGLGLAVVVMSGAHAGGDVALAHPDLP